MRGVRFEWKRSRGKEVFNEGEGRGEGRGVPVTNWGGEEWSGVESESAKCECEEEEEGEEDQEDINNNNKREPSRQ